MASMEEKMAAIEKAAAEATGASGSEEMVECHLDADQLKAMKMADLKALANDMGLKYPFNIKKDDLAKMIAAEPVQVEKDAIQENAIDPEAAAMVAAGAPEAAPETDKQSAAETNDNDQGNADVPMKGRVLVTYTGMVNLRDENLDVVDQAIQGQVFPVTGKREINGAAWYRVEDRNGKACLISGDVVRFMA